LGVSEGFSVVPSGVIIRCGGVVFGIEINLGRIIALVHS